MAKGKGKTSKKKGPKAGAVKINFQGVTSSVLIPEDDYLAKPVQAEQKKSKQKQPTIEWQYEITDGKFKGQKLYHNTSLQPQALWNLRGVLEAMGMDVPDGKMDVDLDAILAEAPEVGVNVYQEVFDGKKKSKIGDIFPADDMGESDSDPDSDDGDDDGDDGTEIDLDSIDDMDKDELQELVDEHDIEVDLKDFKSIAKKRKAVKEAIEADSDSDDDDDDDDGDDGDDGDDDGNEYEKDDINDMDAEELDELCSVEEITIKKGDKKKVKDYRKSVIKALKKAGITVS